MFMKKELTATLANSEIGATGEGVLQIVLEAEGRRVTLKMTEAEARFAAYALTHWADVSIGLSPPTPDYIKPLEERGNNVVPFST